LNTKHKESLTLLCGTIDVIYHFLEQTDPKNCTLPVQLNILLSFFIDKRLDEKVKQAEGGIIPLDARTKAEIKLLVELIKFILGRPEIVSALYLTNDFTCVRRPMVSVMLKRSTDVTRV
jgi:hypothetical protein